MKILAVFLLVIAAIASSAFQATQVYGQTDVGAITLKQFTYSIAIDCEKSQLLVMVMDADNMPVKDATIYLQYLEDSYRTMSYMKTPENGKTIHQLPGNTSYMRSRWNLLIEKSGYRSKTVQFDLAPCYSDWEPTVYHDEEPTTQIEEVEDNDEDSEETKNEINETNQSMNSTENQNIIEEKTENDDMTPIIFMILVLALGIITIRYVKHTKPRLGIESVKLYWRKKEKQEIA
jgi:hypothetical protein